MPSPATPSRRTFLASSAATLALASSSRLAAGAPAERDPAVVELVRGLVAANDDRIPGLLARQERRPGHRWLGGMLNEYGLHTPHGAQGLIIPLVAAACSPGGTSSSGTSPASSWATPSAGSSTSSTSASSTGR